MSEIQDVKLYCKVFQLRRLQKSRIHLCYSKNQIANITMSDLDCVGCVIIQTRCHDFKHSAELLIFS